MVTRQNELSQPDFVGIQSAEQKDLYIACADRWMPNAPDYDYTHYGPLYDRLFDPDVEKTPADWALLANLPQEDTRNADYVWLPILLTAIM